MIGGGNLQATYCQGSSGTNCDLVSYVKTNLSRSNVCQNLGCSSGSGSPGGGGGGANGDGSCLFCFTTPTIILCIVRFVFGLGLGCVFPKSIS